jgi:hypothetical protein
METEKALQIIQKLKAGEISSAQDKDCADYSAPFSEYSYDCLHCAFWYNKAEGTFYQQKWNTDGFENITHEHPKVALSEEACIAEMCQYASLFEVR